MSHTLTETISFDPSVVVPDILDTDYPTTVPQGVQALANRSQFLLDAHNTLVTATNAQADALNIVRSRAVFSVGTGTPGGLAALGALFDGTVSPGAYNLSSNRIHVPFAGKYILSCSLVMRAISVTPLGVNLYLGDSLYKGYFVNVSSAPFQTPLAFSEFLDISSASTQLINLRLDTSAAQFVQAGTLTLQRLI